MAGPGGPDLSPGPDLRLLPAAGFAWCLAWWATAAGARAVLVAAGVATCALAGLLAVVLPGVRRTGPADRPAGRAPALSAALLVVSVAAVLLATTGARLWHRQHDPLTVFAVNRSTATVTGRLTTDPRRLAPRDGVPAPGPPAGDRWLVRLSVSRVEVGGRAVRASGQLLVFGRASWGDLVAGSHVRVRGRLAATEPGDPASASVSPRGSPVRLDRGNLIWRVAERLRAGLRDACRGLPPDSRGLLPALVVGDTTHLDQQLAADLRASGLTHLTAVSGGNLAVIAAAAVATLGAAGGGRRLRVTGTALVIGGFVVLARPEPSVLRAAVMGSLALVALLRRRRSPGVPLLAASAIALLLADPWLARSFGFVLSVLATAGLLLLVPAWVRQVPPRWRPVAAAVGVPVAAQLATAPVTVLLDPSLSLVTVPANLLVSVAVAPATVAGVMAAAVSTVWPGGARLVATAGGWATSWIALVAHRAAGLPGASMPWPSGPGGAVLLAVPGVVLVLWTGWRTASPATTGRTAGTSTRCGAGERRTGPGLLWPAGLSLVVVLGGLTAPAWVPVLRSGGRAVPADWLVVQCDVGQGSSTVIRTGTDRAMLVDTGPEPDLEDSCLRRAGVAGLDLVVLTHFHADHVGGLAGALRGRGKPPVLVSPLSEPDDQARRTATVVAEAGSTTAPVRTATAGGAGAVRWTLLPPPVADLPVADLPVAASGAGPAAAPGAGRDPREELDGTEINNASVVVLAVVQGLRVMLLGDVEPEAQRPLEQEILAGAIGPPAVDVVVVAHHGSARQEPALYASLHPRIALIGVGAGNDYGHPAPSALAMLNRIGALTLRTDTQGQIDVCGSPDRLRVVTG